MVRAGLMHLRSLDRKDKNPRPDLPVMLVVSTQTLADQLQHGLHPAEFWVVGAGHPLLSIRVRAIILAISDLEERIRSMPPGPQKANSAMLEQWINEAKMKLPPECAGQIHRVF